MADIKANEEIIEQVTNTAEQTAERANAAAEMMKEAADKADEDKEQHKMCRNPAQTEKGQKGTGNAGPFLVGGKDVSI